MSADESQDSVTDEILNAIEDLVEMGLIEVVGIKPDGEWLYGPTEAGKKAVRDVTLTRGFRVNLHLA